MIDIARELVKQAIAATGGTPDVDEATTLKNVLPEGTSSERLGIELSQRLTGIALPVPSLTATISLWIRTLTLRIPPRLYACSATTPPHLVTNPVDGRCPDHNVRVSSGSHAQILEKIRL